MYALRLISQTAKRFDGVLYNLSSLVAFKTSSVLMSSGAGRPVIASRTHHVAEGLPYAALVHISVEC